jgi:hypothetical protein
MACTYAIRPNFDHMVQLRVYIDYVNVPVPQQLTSNGWTVQVRGRRGRVRSSYMIIREDDQMDYKGLLESNPDSPVIQWLNSDAAVGQWTYKYFLNRILISFSDKDTAFAFKMRWL